MSHRHARVWIAVAIAVAGVAASCGDDEDPDAAAPPGSTSPVAATSDGATDATADATADGATGGRCLVRLHGKGETGAETTTQGDVTVIRPTGNADGWGGRQWLYAAQDEYDAARGIVAESIEGCDQVILAGFSNGGAFAAALYCRGETLDGRLVGVVVDDPVPDHAADGCAPAPSVPVTLYWTGALEATAVPGWNCEESDWTCAGGETIGIEAFAEALGSPVVASASEDHQPYLDAPALTAWP